MRIVKLTAENVKRLRAVEITPEGDIVVIAGRNAQGKTSVLDAIWFALGGGQACRGTAKPIRDGESDALVQLDLGDLVVTRTWSGESTGLRVEAKDGARYSSPQSMLDRLVGRLSFDPLAFSNLPEREQLATLLGLVDLPFSPAALDGERTRLFEARTIVGRDGKTAAAQLAGMPAPPAGLPAQEVSAADLIRRHQELTTALDRRREGARRIELAEGRLAQLQAELAAAANAVDAARRDLPPEPDGNVEDLAEQLAEVETTNRAVRAAAARAAQAELAARLKGEYDSLSAQIAALDERKSAAIREAQMPIDGLAFDSTGVTYRGIPFKQCSSAEQLRVSLAMAMALNPQIRVIRITDGSLLDSSNMALIAEMAAAEDYQVWIERVDESGAVGIVIEDGAVAAATAEAATV